LAHVQWLCGAQADPVRTGTSIEEAPEEGEVEEEEQ